MSIYSLGASKNNTSNLKSTTKINLESMGIDSSMVTSEDEAQSILDKLKEAQSSTSSSTANQQKQEDVGESGSSSTNAQLNEAKTLASVMGISVTDSDTLDDILASISAKIDELLSSHDESIQSLGRAYQAQLAGIVSSSSSSQSSAAMASSQSGSQQRIYSAMDIIAQNNRYFLNI